MKRILLILAMTMCCIASSGQQCNDTLRTRDNEIKELKQKVSSLEHDLKFLGLSYDLYRLKTDISLLTNQLNVTINELKSLIFRDYYTRDSYEMSKKNYDVSIKSIEAFVELMLSTKFKYDSVCSSYPLYQVELDNLKASWKSIEAGYALLKNTGEMYKLCIDTYKGAL